MEQFRHVIEFGIRGALRCNILPDHLGEPEGRITRNAYLVDDLGADDLDLSQIAADLSELYGLPDEFDSDKVATARTVDDLVRLTADAYIAAHTAAYLAATA